MHPAREQNETTNVIIHNLSSIYQFSTSDLTNQRYTDGS
jgi:hypothetical protein